MNKTIAIFALAAATFAAIPAYATRFIYDVKLIGGTKSETDSLKSTYQAQGWKVIDKDLNKGCGASSDYIYLIRYAFDKPSGEFAAITNVYMNAAGRPVVQARVPENTEGVTLKVLSSGDLQDWSKAGWKVLTVESGGTLVFEDDTDPQRFYRLKAE